MSPPNLSSNDHACRDESIAVDLAVEKQAPKKNNKQDQDNGGQLPATDEIASDAETSALVAEATGKSASTVGIGKSVSFREPIAKAEHSNSDHPSTSPLPLFSISHGLKRKATPLAINSWVALSLTLDGRDKITKVVQYGARLLAWWLSRHQLTAAQAKRFKALYTQVAMSRKAFRLGRSITELEKLRQIGLISTVFWHLRLALDHGDSVSSSNETPTRPQLPRKASSNIGWGPSTASESQSIYRSLSSFGSRMYRPMISRLSSLAPAPPPDKAPTWKIVGMSLKLLGLLGFWAGDNVSFLASTGFLDDYTLVESDRLSRRKRIQNKAVVVAFRSYFLGAVAGLIVNAKAYWNFRQHEVKSSHEHLAEVTAESAEPTEEEASHIEKSRLMVKKTGEKQFVLFLAVLKSCCDVLVFSNNTGIDLHKRYRGKKMHEGFHCLCGLISASTVLYNNYPNAK